MDVADGTRLAPPELLETPHLILRRIGEDDAEAIFENYASDPEVTRYLSWPTHTSIDHARDYTRYGVKAWEEGTEYIWIIEREGELLGGLSFGVRGHRAILGYVLRRDAWNQGFMTEAVGTLVDWLQKEPSIQRIEARCAIDNPASARVLEKLGLEHEGVLRAYWILPNLSQDPQDLHMYARVTRRDRTGGSHT